MIDLETMGTEPGSLIVSIGAVAFDSAWMGETFYRRIDWQSGIDAGLTLDADTVRWWLEQGAEATQEITLPGEPLRDVLGALADFVGVPEELEIWGNGANFDGVLLTVAYRRVGMPVPWRYSQERCYRTMKKQFPQVTAPPRIGVKHHALTDAIYQARHLQEILSVAGGPALGRQIR